VGMYNFCYYNALESFAPDEHSFHTAHPLFYCAPASLREP
jgi:hypothetical protein